MSLSWSSKDHKGTNQAAGQKRTRSDSGNKVTVVLGAQWGDEGKGKVVDLLATEADIVCRCQVCLDSTFHSTDASFFFIFFIYIFFFISQTDQWTCRMYRKAQQVFKLESVLFKNIKSQLYS